MQGPHFGRWRSHRCLNRKHVWQSTLAEPRALVLGYDRNAGEFMTGGVFVLSTGSSEARCFVVAGYTEYR